MCHEDAGGDEKRNGCPLVRVEACSIPPLGQKERDRSPEAGSLGYPKREPLPLHSGHPPVMELAGRESIQRAVSDSKYT